MEEGNIKMKEVSILHKQIECTFSRQGEIRTVSPRVGLLGVFAKLRKTTISFVMSVCLSVCPSLCLSAWNNLASTGRIFMKFGI